MENTTFAVIGGDMRNVYIKELLRSDGHFVRSYASSQNDTAACADIGRAIENCRYIIGPTPFSADGVFLNAPLVDKKLYVDDFLCKIQPRQKLFAGSVSRACREMFDQFQIDAVDFLTKKEMTVLNAIPTAEGALKIAIDNSHITLHGSRSLVIGYGNIGKILAKHLRDLGAETYVAARRPESLAEAFANALRPVNVAELKNAVAEMDFIFNTAPAVLIDWEAAKNMSARSLYVELASNPGIDMEAAQEFGLHIISALSLPGKISPKTTAKNIVQTIYGIINKEEPQ